MDNNILNAAKRIWNYCYLGAEPKQSDIILALGSADSYFVALKSAHIYHAGLAPKIIVSGGVLCHIMHKGKNLKALESNIMCEILLDQGIKDKDIILETQSKNTGDNFSCTKKLLSKLNEQYHSVLVVTKPYIERRAKATSDIHMPDKNICITSFDMSFEEYFLLMNQKGKSENFLHVLVGTINRILDYPNKGFQSYQEVPKHILQDVRFLEQHGFTGDYQRNVKYPSTNTRPRFKP